MREVREAQLHALPHLQRPVPFQKARGRQQGVPPVPRGAGGERRRPQPSPGGERGEPLRLVPHAHDRVRPDAAQRPLHAAADAGGDHRLQVPQRLQPVPRGQGRRVGGQPRPRVASAGLPGAGAAAGGTRRRGPEAGVEAAAGDARLSRGEGPGRGRRHLPDPPPAGVPGRQEMARVHQGPLGPFAPGPGRRRGGVDRSRHSAIPAPPPRGDPGRLPAGARPRCRGARRRAAGPARGGGPAIFGEGPGGGGNVVPVHGRTTTPPTTTWGTSTSPKATRRRPSTNTGFPPGCVPTACRRWSTRRWPTTPSGRRRMRRSRCAGR